MPWRARWKCCRALKAKKASYNLPASLVKTAALPKSRQPTQPRAHRKRASLAMPLISSRKRSSRKEVVRVPVPNPVANPNWLRATDQKASLAQPMVVARAVVMKAPWRGARR